MVKKQRLKIKRKRKTTGAKLKKKRRTKEKNRSLVTVDFFPSGSTRLNLALCGRADRGWARGRMLNIVGDKSAGKTLLALDSAAHFYYYLPKIKSKLYPQCKKPIVVYNNAEGVLDFDIERMYGTEFVDNFEAIRSPHVQHMGRDFISRALKLKKHESLLYIVDTWDMLRSSQQLERFDTSLTSDSEEKGSYDGEKQKWASGFFAKHDDLMHRNVDATLMVVSQVRMKMNTRPFQKSRYRTGGKSFDHAVHQEAWIWEKKKVDATRHGEKRIYSVNVGVKIEKNKTYKPFREAEFTILYDYGIDDLNSLIRYIWWKPSDKKPITFKSLKFSEMKRLIGYIEENNYEQIIKKKAERKFQAVEKAFEDEVACRKKRWCSPIIL